MGNTTTSKVNGEAIFPPELVTEMFNAVRGHSALARLCTAKPMPFAGTKEMVFTMDGEAEIVGEGAQKSPNDAGFNPVTIVPVKFVYQHRVTDEFKYMSEEAQLPYLQAFADGFAKKIARGLDIAAMHGINPISGAASTVVGTNHFDAKVSQTATYTAGTSVADDVLDTAIQTILGNERDVNGVAMSALFGQYMAAVKVNGVVQHPEFRFGGKPAAFAGMGVDVNTTVNKKLSAATSRDLAIAGDFANAFRWGYAKNIPLEIIEFGDPDGQGDLKRQNQIELRSEAYIGWGILDGASFCRIVDAVTAGQTS
jgi:HK97 family phage major capsid protein